MSSFNHIGTYKCECGKEFTNSQSFNGHKSHCKIHLENLGKLDARIEVVKAVGRTQSENARIIREAKEKAKIEAWLATNPKCEYCGKELTEYFGSGRFCSMSCAAANSNKNREKQDTNIICEICGKEFKSKQAYNIHYTMTHTGKEYKYTPREYKRTGNTKHLFKVCDYCGKKFERISKGERYDNGLYSGTKFCSIECKSISRHNRLSAAVKKSFAEGRNVGFIPRNNPSYFEKFWIKVLDNNDIKYEFNKTVTHTPTEICPGSWFSLDFYIEKNNKKIDLEIDGKQHNYEERKIFDIERDKILSDLGYVVYRIPCCNPNNSDELGKQVEEFISWYSNI